MVLNDRVMYKLYDEDVGVTVSVATWGYYHPQWHGGNKIDRQRHGCNSNTTLPVYFVVVVVSQSLTHTHTHSLNLPLWICLSFCVNFPEHFFYYSFFNHRQQCVEIDRVKRNDVSLFHSFTPHAYVTYTLLLSLRPHYSRWLCVCSTSNTGTTDTKSLWLVFIL